MLNERLHLKTSLLAMAIFTFFGFLAYNTPLGGDDWAWGSAFGEEQWKNWFDNYNGRYLSNSLVIILAKVQWLRVLFMALISTMLVMLIGRLGSQHQEGRMRTAIALILFLIVPVNMFGQTFGWLSGYVNYVFSAVLLLMYITINNKFLDAEEPQKFLRRDFLLMTLLGLLTPLVVEHVTLFIVFTSFLTILYTLIRFKKLYAIHLTYTVASIIGTVLMLSNRAYAGLFGGQASYGRVVYADRPDMFFDIFKESITPILFIDSYAIHMVLSGLMVLFLMQKGTDGKKPKVFLKYGTMSFFLGVIFFFLVIRPALGDYYLGEFTEDAEALFFIFYFLALSGALFVFSTETKNRTRFAFYAIGVLLMTAPFSVLYPYGPRVAFSAYVFLVMIGTELALQIISKSGISNRMTRMPLYSTVAVLTMFYAFTIWMNGHTDRTRIAKVQNALQNDPQTVEITELPYPQYHWMPTPLPGNSHIEHYRNYYGIPDSTDIIVQPYFPAPR
ncbi:DUF6056 family protein [Bhargavaea ginsengi]|uniref:DUF6056 family protein n=1 Tax=Bhargavaea ginsengi TaxID=426757 RepID=UPI00203CB39A|nr:DUF6056 family protein [Bhargavaea ginsengi]MCM3089353.1 DUF6056 family protein [Bhargavaea ginsengi]